jgi:hypothetical protein
MARRLGWSQLEIVRCFGNNVHCFRCRSSPSGNLAASPPFQENRQKALDKATIFFPGRDVTGKYKRVTEAVRSVIG